MKKKKIDKFLQVSKFSLYSDVSSVHCGVGFVFIGQIWVSKNMYKCMCGITVCYVQCST